MNTQTQNNWNDFNDAEAQLGGFDLIPRGAIVPVRMTIKPGGFDDATQGWSGGYASESFETGSVSRLAILALDLGTTTGWALRVPEGQIDHGFVSFKSQRFEGGGMRYARNAKQHSDAHVAQIAASIAEFGWGSPILVDGQNNVIAGHGRLLAARKLGMSEVPVVTMEHLTDIQRKALILADNKIGENASWDDELLGLELAELQDSGFDLALTGFTEDEWDKLISGDEGTEGLTDEDAVPEVTEDPVSQPGDVWLLGEHKILCGDATKAEDYKALLGDELADMTVTDPPYNVNYANTAKDKMRGTNRPILNDNMGDGFAGFLLLACQNILDVTKGAVYIAMSSSELDTLQSAFRAAGGKWSTFIIWAKNTFTMGRADYQRQYEPILYGWRDGAQHYWCGARDQGDVWQIKKPHKNDLHPTMKPVELMERAVRNSSKTRDIVLDPFGGSGTTLIACEKSGRRARLIELDPKYVDVIVKRWQDFTGKEAQRASDGGGFNVLVDASAFKSEPAPTL